MKYYKVEKIAAGYKSHNHVSKDYGSCCTSQKYGVYVQKYVFISRS